MNRNFKFLAVLLLFLTGAGLAHALQCKSGSSSCSTSSASDCTSLGYSSSDVSNCKHYLLCPFNTNYKTCVAFDDSEPEPDCSDYPLTKCPEHGICDECPDDKTYLKFTDCESGYVLNAAKTKCLGPCDKSADEHCKTWSSELEDCECSECEDFYENKDGKCVPMTCDDDNETADDCKDTETYIVDKTLLNNEVCGHCVDCADENDPHSPCPGMYTCSGDGRVGVGTKECYCNTVRYYEKCAVVETCDTSSKYENGGYCHAYTQDQIKYNTRGKYLVGDKCTKIDLTKVYWYSYCDRINCKGNKGAAYGFKECNENKEVGSGKTIECGGVTYYEKCETLDSCDTNDKYENGGICYAYTQDQVKYNTRGKYLVGDKCTKIDDTKVYWYSYCDQINCKGNKGAAYGFKECNENKEVGSGKTIECGGVTYYEKCETLDSCDTNDKYENGGICYAYTQDQVNRGYTKGNYLVGDKCTKLDNTKVYWYAMCTTSKDCEGNQGPAYNLKTCETGYYAVGTIVECGGNIYGSDCAATCNYELQASDCAENQSFVAHCRDYNNVEFGECVDN